MSAGAINGCIYRSGAILATKLNIAPAQKGSFQFKPRIWIGVASEIEEGNIINSVLINNINTEISLDGLSSRYCNDMRWQWT